MNEIYCPYCDGIQEVDQDDCKNSVENDFEKEKCKICNKYFMIATSISVDHEASKADCLNGGEHKLIPKQWCRRMEKFFSYCDDCGEKIEVKK